MKAHSLDGATDTEADANTNANAGTSDATKLASLAEVVVRLRELPLEHALRSAQLAAEREEELAEAAARQLRPAGRWQIQVTDDSRLLA